MLAVVERARLRVGDRRRVEYQSDPRHRHKRRILAMADEEEAAQAARSGMVAALTPDRNIYLMSANEGPLSDVSSATGASGAVHDVPSSDGCSFHTARGEPHVSKLQMCRALGRELLDDFSTEEEATSPRRRPQSEVPDLPPVTAGLRETVPADCERTGDIASVEEEDT